MVVSGHATTFASRQRWMTVLRCLERDSWRAAPFRFGTPDLFRLLRKISIMAWHWESTGPGLGLCPGAPNGQS